MRSNSRTILLAVTLSAFTFVAGPDVQAQSNSTDPTGFRFLTIGGGARAVALGEAMVADGGDAFATEYNPAGLIAAEKFTLSFSHNAFFQDTHGEYFAAAIPRGQWAFGARLGYLGTGDIPRRTGPSQDPLGYYDAASGILQGAVARVVDDRLSVGISAAFVLEHIESETAHSVVLGIGARYRAHQNAYIGMSFANVGPKAKFDEEEFGMPNQVRFGGAWSHNRLAVQGEMLAAQDETLHWHLGSEFIPDPRLALRGGIRLGYDTQTFSAGVGLRTPDQRVRVDYAFAPYSGDLGSTHRFGLTLQP